MYSRLVLWKWETSISGAVSPTCTPLVTSSNWENVSGEVVLTNSTLMFDKYALVIV